MNRKSDIKKSPAPRLRFPQFRNDKEWEVVSFGQLFKLGSGKDYKQLGAGNVPVYGSGGYMLSVDDYLYNGESACIGRKGTINNPMFLSGKFWTVDTLFYTHSFVDCIPRFIYVHFQNIDWLKHNEAGGVPSLSKTNIEKIFVAVPKPVEQQKIADCLFSLDELITAEAKKLDFLKAQKSSAMQRVFPLNGEIVPRLRFPAFRDSGEWTNQKISALISKTVKPVDVDPETAYREIGIRSHGKGIFHKEPVSGASLGEKRVFWVENNAFVVNIVFAWEQAVAVTSLKEKGMIASHRFPMYTAIPKNSDVNFIKFFFLTKKGKELLGIASPGGAGRNKTLGQKEFENLELLVPSDVAEQTEVANFLSSFDALIAVQIQRIDALKLHKKSLLKRLIPVLDEVQ